MYMNGLKGAMVHVDNIGAFARNNNYGQFEHNISNMHRTNQLAQLFETTLRTMNYDTLEFPYGVTLLP
jgi:hypothetical protein